MPRSYYVVGIFVVLTGAVLWWRTGSARSGAAPDKPGVVSRSGAPLKAGREIAAIPLEVDEAPHGGLSVVGQVLDERGAPVAGAIVAIDTQPPRSVETEADGAFQIADLAARTYEVEAHKADAVAGPLAVRVASDTPPVELRMRRVGALEVTVVDAVAHKPIAGAAVELRGGATRIADTDADGKATLHGVASGTYVVRAAARGYATSFLAHAVAERPEGRSSLAIALRGGVAVSGTVVDSTGAAVAGARVLAEDATLPVVLGNAARDGVTADARGAWRIDALAPGTYRFTARSLANPPGATAPIAITAAHDGVVITVPHGAALTGRVVTADDQPAAFATVRVVVDEGTWGTALARQTTCDARGAFAFAGLPRKPMNIVALADGAASGTRTLDLATATGPVVLALDAAGAISGAVRDPLGKPVAHAIVVAEPAAQVAKTRVEATLRGALATVADEQGLFALTGLPSGKYLLRPSWPGVSRSRTTRLRPVTLAATGAKNVALTLAADATVRGTVQRSDGQPPVAFTVTLGGGAGFAGAGGQFAIADIPAGIHSLTISGPDFATRVLDRVALESGERKDLGVITVVAGRTISGRVVRPDGTPVPGATVAATRRVQGVVAGAAGALVADLKQATAGDDGSFTLAGLTSVELAVGATDPREGKSDFLRVPPGTTDQRFDLVLKPTGGLRGTVTRNREALGGAVVVLSAKGATAGGAGVTTGTDGSFAFDALTPGSYSLIAMVDSGSGPQMKQAQITIKPGAPAQYDIDLPAGHVALIVTAASPTPTGSSTAPADSARVFLTELRQGKPSDNARSDLLTRAAPLRFADLTPGAYQLCAIAPPAGTGSAGTPPQCSYVTITDAPAEQQATIKLGL